MELTLATVAAAMIIPSLYELVSTRTSRAPVCFISRWTIEIGPLSLGDIAFAEISRGDSLRGDRSREDFPLLNKLRMVSVVEDAFSMYTILAIVMISVEQPVRWPLITGVGQIFSRALEMDVYSFIPVKVPTFYSPIQSLIFKEFE